MFIQYQLKSRYCPCIDVFFNEHYCSSYKMLSGCVKISSLLQKSVFYDGPPFMGKIVCENLLLCL